MLRPFDGLILYSFGDILRKLGNGQAHLLHAVALANGNAVVSGNFCVTIDFQTVGDENTPADNCVTVRDRDTMEQVRIPISELKDYIAKKCEF